MYQAWNKDQEDDNPAERAVCEITQRLEENRQRTNLYKLIGRLLFAEIDESLYNELNSPEMRSHLAECGLNLPLVEGNLHELLESLAVAYCDTFVISEAGLMPYESVFRTGRLQSDHFFEVEEFYSNFNFEVSRDNADFLDHLGIELEFMSKLVSAESEALEKSDPIAVEKLRSGQKLFFVRHIDLWGVEFARQLCEKAPHEFYRGLGELCDGFLNLEREVLQVTT